MVTKYITLSNGKSYFINTLPLFHGELTNEYMSYATRSEETAGYSISLSNVYFGQILNGVYSGLTGSFHDNNEHTYTFIPQTTGVKVIFGGQEYDFTADGMLGFFLNGDAFGVMENEFPTVGVPSMSSVPSSASAYCLFTMMASWREFESRYGERNYINLCWCNSGGGRANIVRKTLNYEWDYQGITPYFQTTRGLTIPLSDFDISDSVSDGDDDPFIDDGSSSGGGGQGDDERDNYTDDSDSNPLPSLPTLQATDTGFITLYNPSVSELKALANYMWGDLFDIDTWKKVVADPMDVILGLSILPVDIPTGLSQSVTIGNINTGVSMTRCNNQYVEVNCGTIKISEHWKAYLDYSPYTRVSIFLPFIGSQELDIDLVQATTVGVVYHIDVLSGACVAFITVNGNVIMQFSGQCAVSIPVTSRDFTQTIMALCSLVASGIGVVATGGMSAPVAGAQIAGAVTATANTAQTIASAKPTYAKSGNISGSNGLMGSKYPYLIIEKPRQCLPAHQNSYTGYPSYITSTLSTLSGFTQIQDIHLDGIPCTDSERKEILEHLRAGVIL